MKSPTLNGFRLSLQPPAIAAEKAQKNCNCNCEFLAPGCLLIFQGMPKDVLAVPAQIFGMRGVVGINGFE